MIIIIFNLAIVLNVVFCYESDSSESNRIELTPLFDTIIYSDIADIINDFENNGISQYDVFGNSESQSDESVEDLLSEYQHHLDKAHKQREKYREKSKLKNKVPQFRHDQYSKTKGIKSDDLHISHNFYSPTSLKLLGPPLENTFDIFVPFNSNGRYINNPSITTNLPKGSSKNLPTFENGEFNEKKIINLPSVLHKSLEPLKSSCFCKIGRYPCECNCKQCFISGDTVSPEHIKQMKNNVPKLKKNILWPQFSAIFDNMNHSDYFEESRKDMSSDDTLNIRIQVDLALPKNQELRKYYKFSNQDQTFEPEGIASKEFTSGIKSPFPFHFPVPMDIFNYKKISKFNKEDSSPMQKISIHKKKKFRPNYSNKKHRKKFVAFHDIKVEQQPIIHFGDFNVSDIHIYNNTNMTNDSNLKQQQLQNLRSISNKTSDDVLNITQSPENIDQNNTTNVTEDTPKLENSIETDFTKTLSNETTPLPMVTRDKRDLTNVIGSMKNQSNDTLVKAKPILAKNVAKKSDKNVFTDAELLYWPNITRNPSHHAPTKNITTFIMENELKKNKFNMSKEMIRQNHTRALEEAIFGNVDWNDMNDVVPAFISFVGKYIRGVLTFCSQKVCHSMNCANKTCLHRICQPAERLNNKGHCAGSASEDSVASMESIMDLPSNIAFELVDILQNKLSGKLFGKATFCISSKCITIVTSKKNFVKVRCGVKELNASGHCTILKT